jgi:hypothetical protein
MRVLGPDRNGEDAAAGRATVALVTGGWVRVGVHAIGGLTDIGFAADSQLLIVLSHQGRGVFDCQTGCRVARDSLDDWSYFSEESGIATGIGPLEGQAIAIAGLMSGRSLPTSSGSWNASVTPVGMQLRSSSTDEQIIPESEDLLVFGFAPDGGAFVAGTPSDISLYRRA